jgi:hypothetical protein
LTATFRSVDRLASSSFPCPIPYTLNPIPIPYTLYLYPIPYTLYPIPYLYPYTLNPKQGVKLASSSSPCPIPYTLYPIPYPYTLYPKPQTGGKAGKQGRTFRSIRRLSQILCPAKGQDGGRQQPACDRQRCVQDRNHHGQREPGVEVYIDMITLFIHNTVCALLYGFITIYGLLSHIQIRVYTQGVRG